MKVWVVIAEPEYNCYYDIVMVCTSLELAEKIKIEYENKGGRVSYAIIEKELDCY